MNIFVLGLPKSGRTTLSKKISQKDGIHYIDAVSWVSSSFRTINEDESLTSYQEELNSFILNRLKLNPDLYINNILEIKSLYKNQCFIIDGINSPHDIIKLFDYNNDYIIFLNRTDNEHEYKDHENIGISVIRDYCYWMAASNFLPKERWLEFNFKINGEESDFVKTLGSKNTVYLVKNFNKIIELIHKLVLLNI